ncbi:hypothetical protein NHQ30_001070 [Ciborinia camelliae]|nr:hypothetical protein NHQ30_001070 [Ciborinia camelliae]
MQIILATPSLRIRSIRKLKMQSTNQPSNPPNPPTNDKISQNFIVFECGHKVSEVPSILKKAKRALSLKRALNSKALEPKEIPEKGPCDQCQRAAIDPVYAEEAAFGEIVPLRTIGRRNDVPRAVINSELVPLRTINRVSDDPPVFVNKREMESQKELLPLRINRGKDDPPVFVNKQETEFQKERLKAKIEKLEEVDRKDREFSYGLEEPPPIPRHSVNREDEEDPWRLFLDEGRKIEEAKWKARLEELEEEDRRAVQAVKDFREREAAD